MTLPYILLLSSSIIVFGLLVKSLGGAVWNKLNENENLKYEFITIIAHKFRTPLTQIKWLAEGMVADEQDGYKKEGLQNMQHSTQQLIDLTGTLIELTDSDNASRNSYSFERINMCDLVRGVADTFKNTFHEKNLFLGVQCSTPTIFANIDKPRMEFVLQTLLQNSATYSPPGRNVDVNISTDKHKVVITFADHGIGIDPKDISKIFTKFFRTENAKATDTEGFGVGLYLAQAIVRRHKGKILVFSEGIDRGTTFQIVVPMVG
jgi:two-component system, OmpR family, phosphate regulon sensor histidine kinase PhoR